MHPKFRSPLSICAIFHVLPSSRRLLQPSKHEFATMDQSRREFARVPPPPSSSSGITGGQTTPLQYPFHRIERNLELQMNRSISYCLAPSALLSATQFPCTCFRVHVPRVLPLSFSRERKGKPVHAFVNTEIKTERVYTRNRSFRYNESDDGKYRRPLMQRRLTACAGNWFADRNEWPDRIQ